MKGKRNHDKILRISELVLWFTTNAEGLKEKTNTSDYTKMQFTVSYLIQSTGKPLALHIFGQIQFPNLTLF